MGQGSEALIKEILKGNEAAMELLVRKIIVWFKVLFIDLLAITILA